VPGLEAAVLVDRAGRVVESRGVEDPSRLRKMATLVAALHASGARLSEASGDPGRARIQIEAGERIFLVIPLPRPGTQVLLLVPRAGARVAEAPLVDRLVERLTEELPVSPTMDPRDAAAFESSLEASLRGRGRE
jgi:hypothetical protein